jgi:hypothetical protein
MYVFDGYGKPLIYLIPVPNYTYNHFMLRVLKVNCQCSIGMSVEQKVEPAHLSRLGPPAVAKVLRSYFYILSL